MVQFFQGLEDPRLAAASQAGQQFGQSLSDVLQQHFVNKSIDKLISDPANKDLSTSERLQKMLGQLSRHGPKGMEEFGRRFQLEQIAQQEKEQRKAEVQQKQQQRLTARAIRGEQLTPEEEALLPEKTQIEIFKAKSKPPKVPPGGVTAQPTPTEISKGINDVLNQNKDSGPDELAAAFDQAGIPPIYSNRYVENRRQMQTKPTYEPTEDRLEAERQSKVADDITKDYQGALADENRIDNIIDLAKSNKLSTPAMIKFLDVFNLPVGILGNPLTEAYQKIENDYIKDVSRYFPGQIRVYEAQTYMKTIPSLMNSDEGKLLVAQNLKMQNEAKKIRYQAYKDILKENDGKKPRGMDIKIEERIAPQMKELGERFRENINRAIENFGPKTTMYDEKGNRYEVPQNKINAALQNGLHL